MTRNTTLAAATLPFRPTVKNPGDIILSTHRVSIVPSCRADRFCRCRTCKPSLIGAN